MNEQLQQWIRDQRAIKTLTSKIRKSWRKLSKNGHKRESAIVDFERLVIHLEPLRGSCRLSLATLPKDERERMKRMLRPIVEFYNEL